MGSTDESKSGSSGGTYVLVIDVPQSTTIEVGALGDREFAVGAYAYVGSAFGPGGFARVDRRRSVLRRALARGARENATANSPAASATPATGTSITCSVTRKRNSRPPSRSPTPIGSANWPRRSRVSRSRASAPPTATVRRTCSPRRRSTPCSRRRSMRAVFGTARSESLAANRHVSVKNETRAKTKTQFSRPRDDCPISRQSSLAAKLADSASTAASGTPGSSSRTSSEPCSVIAS
ncbi:protein of unknown function DUF123 [Halopiger xanaduensis SH-6]|uniref:Uncharacterized protein n=1 Tax=Halopiger xanaduensis (strain DSM 18323 / JCM 14033 / SH-6) TaxID=797210 RepID=F8DCE9_HALXS|nr:protein of unknown function DUF123 [Halopiger xanaduensis SH-6]